MTIDKLTKTAQTFETNLRINWPQGTTTSTFYEYKDCFADK